jgi:exodeoxyribonuclease VII small subunit
MANLKLSYNEAVAEIEKLLAELNGDATDIDELAQKVKRIVELLDLCKRKLNKTETELSKIFGESES